VREEWDESQHAEIEPVAQQLNDLRDAIDRLNERIDALEED
jgi:ubiquinone biosynthesis protein UbiJ